MPSKKLMGMLFDARPDRIDFRDLVYRPPLRGLPHQYPSDEAILRYLPIYQAQGMVLDQGTEGACTGFGLAAVVNYLRWEVWVTGVPEEDLQAEAKGIPAKVSPRMLYQNARLYDEWKGEDYEGSSCRGAMKGFHKHGVSSETLWPYYEKGKKPGQSRDGWDQDAARCPLGAYYRIDAQSLVDMQAAIHEVHAIYVSGEVHDGWVLKKKASIDAAKIRHAKRPDELGGHAYSIVGYRSDGFIIQNSWGPDWGYHGFALLPYEEWVKYGQDAWVLAIGAPMLAQSPKSRTSVSLEKRAAARAPILAKSEVAKKDYGISPWVDGEETSYCVFVGHDGGADRELVEAYDGSDHVRRVVDTGIRKAAEEGTRHVAIYVHGGLNDREAGLNRARVLGPWFVENGIHPIFIIWQTGFLESAFDILKIAVDRLGSEALPQRVDGWVIDRLKEIKDRAFEVTAREIGVKAIWEKMKSRAIEASRGKGAMSLVTANLKSAFSGIESEGKTAPAIHLMGHSAGAILMGAFLAPMKAAKLRAESIHLWAPACTVDFANDTFSKAFSNGTATKTSTFIDILNDRNEVSDPCVPVVYSKSLLYLVSRSLEPVHKTPVLGLEKAWDAKALTKDVFAKEHVAGVKKWIAQSAGVKVNVVKTKEVPTAIDRTREDTIKASHGSFDNNLDVVNAAFRRVLGKTPPRVVTSLKGF